MSFQVGDLVGIQGLQSEQGRLLNGSLGKVVDCSTQPRFGVHVYSKPATANPSERMRLLMDCSNIKSFNASNLLKHDSCCPLYLEAILQAAMITLQTGMQMEAGSNFLRDYVSRKPDDLPMAATLANIVRDAGEYEYAVSLTSNVIANLSAAPLQLQAEEHRLRYDLGCSLSVLGRAAEAFAQAQAINSDRGGEPLELKIELFSIIARSLKFHETRKPAPRNPNPIENPNRSFTLQLELQVRREEVRLAPTNAAALLDIAALLCKLGSQEQLAEGIEMYTRALQASQSRSDIALQTRIRDGLNAAIATRDANLADGRQGRLLGGDDTEMWFIDSTFVEGVHYAVFESEEAALAYGHVAARVFSTGAGSSSARDRFWLYNIGAPNLVVWKRDVIRGQGLGHWAAAA